jgi:cell division septal protein FtsQ
MWDKPDLLNAVASLLFASAFLLAAYGAVHYVVRLPAFPLREVRINGELSHVTLDQVETIVRRELQGNFFTLDLAAARAAFEKLPWVRKVNVRRQWPDRLDVALEEHVPLARWGDAALINTQGEVFTAASDGAPASREQGPAERGGGTRLRDASSRESGAALSSAGVASVSGVTSPKGAPVPTSGGAPASREQGSRLRDASGRESGAAPSSAGVASVSGVTSPKGAPVPTSGGALPLFIGPPESAKVMAIQYGYFQRSLAAIGQVPVQVQVSPRRAWQVRLDSGLVIELGRDSIESRLDRFTAVYDRTVNRLQRKLDYVDLRYPNGFAVRIPELRHDPREKRRGGKTARATG